MTDDKRNDTLEGCLEYVQRLEEENQFLRQASGTFGQLAERLNETLQEERRTGAERRRAARLTQDRRASSHSDASPDAG